MEKALVSVIIPFFNSIDSIEETVQSVLNQTYQNIEVILVDDGSTDNSDKLFSKFEKAGIHCFRTKNLGSSNARNIGFANSKGEYIQYLDSDDILHPKKIELQLNSLEQTNSDMSYSLWENFSNDISKTVPFKFRNIPYWKPSNGHELMISFGMENWFIPPISWLTKRAFIEKAGKWNVKISNNDDGEFFARVLSQSPKVICIEKVLGFYRNIPNSNSLSKLNSKTKIESALKSYSLIENHLNQFSNQKLLSYPKRLYYKQFEMIRFSFPAEANKAASGFDKINAPCFLSKKKKYWLFIKIFGLWRGTIYFSKSKRIYKKIRGII